MLMSLAPETLRRFWKNVNQTAPDGCWVWTGVLDKDGYGVFSIAGKKLKAHRLSHQLHNGPLTRADVVLHSCDNRPCVQPKHLSPGTPKSNAIDRAQKGRSARHQGNANGRAKLNEKQVAEIRRLWQTGEYTKRGLAQDFNVTDVLIGKIIRRELWSHIGGQHALQASIAN